jgi:hypothetical protein
MGRSVGGLPAGAGSVGVSIPWALPAPAILGAPCWSPAAAQVVGVV